MADKEAKIKFTAEASEFNDAIKDADGNLKELRSELRLNSSEMNTNGESQDGLQERLNILNQEMEAAQEKTSAVSEKLELAKEIYGENSTEVQNLQVQLNNCQTVENAIQSDINNTSEALKNQSDSWGQVEKSMAEIAPQAAAIAGTLTAAGKESLDAAAEIKEGYDNVITATGATGESLDGLKTSMENVMRTMNVSADEAGGAIGEVNTRFGLTGKSLEDTSSLFLKFASITGTDVVSSVGSASKIMNQYGLDASDTEGLLNTLAATSQSTGISTSTLMDTVQNNAGTFQTYGMSVEDAIELTGNMEKAGVNSTTVLGQMRSKASDLAEMYGGTCKDGLEKMCTQITDAKSREEALGVATKVFSGRSAAELVNALRNGTLSFDDLSSSMGDYDGNVNTTYENTQNSADKMGIAFNNIKLSFSEMGTSMLEAAEPVVDVVVGMAQSISKGFQSLPGPVKTAIVAIGGIVAVIASIVTIVGIAGGALGAIAGGLGTLGGIITGIAGVLSGVIGAIGSVIAVLGGPLTVVIAIVIAAVVAIVTHWEKVKSVATSVASVVVSKFTELKNAVISAFNSIGSTISTIWNGIKAVFTTVFVAIATIVLTYFNLYKAVITTALNVIKRVITTVWNGIKAVFNVALTFINKSVISKFNAIKSAITAVMNVVKSKISSIWTGIKSKIISVVTSIVSGVKNKFNSLKSGVTSIFNGIKSKATSIFNGVKSAITKPVDAAKNTVSNVVKKIKGFFTGLKLKIPTPSLPSLPHFSLKTSSKTVLGKKITYPTGIGVSWHEKGGIFKQPTLLQSVNGSVHGVGEAGAEAITPLASLKGFVQDSMQSIIDSNNVGYEKFDYEKFANAASRVKNVIKLNGRELARA
ncbi:MAG: phage tail tape measure protein [Anaerostipes sp.]|nr:phage tail tape measure protein [Anaerostipes sp.]